jgi:hypothetical protein
MLRAFLFGLAWFLAIVGLIEAAQYQQHGVDMTGLVILAVFWIPAGIAFWGARRARPNLSPGYAVLGGLLGFLCPIVLLWALWAYLVFQHLSPDYGPAHRLSKESHTHESNHHHRDRARTLGLQSRPRSTVRTM